MKNDLQKMEITNSAGRRLLTRSNGRRDRREQVAAVLELGATARATTLGRRTKHDQCCMEPLFKVIKQLHSRMMSLFHNIAVVHTILNGLINNNLSLPQLYHRVVVVTAPFGVKQLRRAHVIERGQRPSRIRSSSLVRRIDVT